MKNYIVTIPITGHVDIACSFEGEPNDDGLENAAMDQWDKMSSRQQRDCTTWEFTPQVSTGNVSHAECNEMSWDETDCEPVEDNPPTKDQLGRRVARLAGEIIFSPHLKIKVCTITPVFLVRELRFHFERLTKVQKTKLAKLEDALAAWEAAE